METWDKDEMLFHEILNTVEHVTMENKISYAQILGVLDLVKNFYIQELEDHLFDNDEDDE